MLLETKAERDLIGGSHEYIKLVLHRSNYKLPNYHSSNIQNISFNDVNKFALAKLKSEAGDQDGVLGAAEGDSGLECNICSIRNGLELFCASGGKLVDSESC